MSNLKEQVLSGVIWTLIQSIGSKGLSFIVLLLLAKLLSPDDFGLIGMLMIFIQISETIIEGGFNLALLQKKNIDDIDYSSVFWINFFASIFLYIIIFFFAPLIAKFYEQEILTSLVRVVSIVIIINSFCLIQETKLTKDINFKALTLAHLPSIIISGTIGVLMALKGFGVWSLVIYQIFSRFTYAIQIWFISKWKPLIIIDFSRVKTLFSFGANILISNILHVFYINSFNVILGRFYQPKVVGYYQNSFNITSVPSATLTGVLSKVIFPTFATIQDDNEKLKLGYKKVIQQAFFWITPLYIFAGILAQPLFEFLFNPSWIPSVPYFKWLCVVAIFSPLVTYNLTIINIKGKSKLFLKLEVYRKVLTIIGMISVMKIGIMAMLFMRALSELVSYLIFSYYGGRLINYKTLQQLKDLLQTSIICFLSGLVVYFTYLFMLNEVDNLLMLIISSLLGFISYFFMAFITKNEAMIEFKFTLIKILKR